MSQNRLLFAVATVAILLTPTCGYCDKPNPPDGFRALFNGEDLEGWYGLNPHSVAKLTGEKKEASLREQRSTFAQHWRVENGELVNDGHGAYATSTEEFGDIEFLIEYKTVAKADSGIYLRGTPQVQIWDWNQVFDPKRPERKPHLGSGGLFNNTPDRPGRDPMVIADKPFGEWNQFRIRQIGARTWIWLNEKLVVEGAVMENFWDRKQPLPDKGPIMLQTHGGEIRWRNLFVREFNADEAQDILFSRSENSGLAAALTLHASFDETLDADFSRGDRTIYVKQGKELLHAEANEDAKLVPDGGKFGGALHFTKKSRFQPSFKDSGVLGYDNSNWNTTVSVWMRLNTDEDLEPGYCDPVQIVGDDGKKGFIFLELSKDERPRYFRYAIRPLFGIWNPNNVSWSDIPFEKRPMVQVERPPFKRDAWTHVVFTIQNVNNKEKKTRSGRLYLNGELQGAIEGWDLTLDWDPSQVLLVLGASYVGHMDDLAVFNRALSQDEINQVYQLKAGVSSLYNSVKQ